MISNQDLERARALRRELHARPELSGREAWTARRIGEFLAACNPVALLADLGAGHGLAVVFGRSDSQAGPTVVLRAELDALPTRETARPAHLCGHDGHLAILCGVGLALRERPPAAGRVVLLAQPAEETGRGARAIAVDPRYAALAPDWVFALHNLPGYPLGCLLIRDGSFTAGSVGLSIHLHGRTSQAATPARALADLVTGLVTLPIAAEARGELALVTVVRARLGEAEILATLRAARKPVLDELREGAARLVRRVAARDGLEVALDWVEEFPAVVNDPRATALATAAARDAGLALTAPAENPFRWSEDFGWLLHRTPGALLGLGAGEAQPDLHAADYDFPDPLIEPGVRFWLALLRQAGVAL